MIRLSTRLPFILLFILFSFISFSQEKITGEIFNKKSKEPLAYASVVIKDTNIGVLADGEGIFELTVPEKHAKDSLIINYIGYESTTFPINQEIKLYPMALSENMIEQIVVTNLDVDSIMQLVEERYVENHIKHNTKQAGFMRASFKESGKLFQVSESSYDVYYEKKKDGAKRTIHPTKSRMVIDSAAYKRMNEVFHFKKDTFIVDPLAFIEAGQSFSSVEDKEDKKWTYVYEHLGNEEYQGRTAYRIGGEGFRKKVKFMRMTFLIDTETYALLSFEYESENTAQINKLVPFTAKVLLSVLGYDFRINDIRGKTYYRYNGDFFELDKGYFYLSTDVARGGEWISGNMTQEFYLKEQVPIASIPKKRFIDNEVVSAFDDQFFSKHFHLPTSEKTHELIQSLQEKNKKFSGEIYSDKHKKWLKKKERKQNKKNKE